MGSQIGSWLGGTGSGGSGGGGGGLYGGTMSGTIPTQTGLNFVNWNGALGGVTITNVDQGILLNVASAQSGGAAIICAPAPTAPYTVTATMAYSFTTANTGLFGIGWTAGTRGDTGGAQQAQMMWYCPTCSSGFQQRIFNYTNASSNAQLVNQSAAKIASPWFFRIKDDGTNVTFSISFDGLVYTTVYTVAKASGFLGATGYNNIAFGADGMSAAGYTALLSWKVTSP